MEPMDFRELATKVIALYHEGSYTEALEVVHEGRERFSDEDSTLTRFEADLLSIGGEAEQALVVLNAGLDRGLGWHPKALLDPDLDAARALEGWKSFEERSAAQVAEWDVERPSPLVRNAPNPIGTVVVLHGAGSAPDTFFNDWEAATPPRWAMVVPVGDVPMSKTEWAWSFGLKTDSLVVSLADLSLTDPVVLSGFSQGGRLAAKGAWDGDIDTAGLILFAANITPELWSESNQRTVPTYVVAGTEDAHDVTLATTNVLRSSGVPVTLDTRVGLGHTRPDDLDRTMAAALDWIVSQI